MKHSMRSEPVAEDKQRRISEVHEVPVDAVPKSRWERSWPTIACGAGLFSDGYLNGVCITPSQHSLRLTITVGNRIRKHHAQDYLLDGIY